MPRVDRGGACCSTGATIPSIDDDPANGTARTVEVRLELVAVVAKVARHRVHGEVSERAERLAEHAVAHVVEKREVADARPPVLELRQELDEPARPDATRRALPARLVHVELRGPQRELHHAAAVVDDDDRRGAEERPGRPDRVVVHRRVDLRGRQHRNGRAAGNHRLELATARDTACDVVDQLAQRHSELALVVSGPLDVPGQREHRRPRRGGDADLRERLGAQLDDLRNERDRAHVVDLRRCAVQAVHGRERRPRARLAALTFERLEERGLLAADVRARPAVQDDRDSAQQTRPSRLVERGAHDLELVEVFAADVDEHALRSDSMSRDQTAFDQPVRREPHHVAILVRAGLRLVGVHDEVHGLSRVLGEERGLAPHREAGAAASAQGRVRDLVDYRLRLERPRLRKRLVAAHRAVLVETGQVVLRGARREKLRCGHGSPRRSRPRRRAGRARGSDGRRRRPARARSRPRTRSPSA